MVRVGYGVRVIQADPVAAGVLGPVKGQVSGGKQLEELPTVLVQRGDPDGVAVARPG